MTRRVFRIGGWVVMVAGALTAAATMMVAVIGVLALTGKVTYPVNIEFGPFSARSTVSMPIALAADVCQRADVTKQETPSDCFRFFVHEDDPKAGNERIRRQDADIRPTSATFTGKVELVSTGGWSPLVASSVARRVISLAVLSGVLLMLWRLLAAAAAGDVFSPRAVRWVRGIGWLVIAGGVAAPVLNLFTSASQLGYSMEAFGAGPQLMPLGPGGVNLVVLALGGLVLLVAEIFRHGATIEAERRLTI